MWHAGGGGENKFVQVFGWKTLMKEAAQNTWKDNIKLDMEIGWKGVDWLYLVCDSDCWWVVVNKVMNPRLHKMQGIS